MTQVIDGRGTETRYEYDGQGRETTKKAAYGLSIEARTDTFYDLAGNVTEVRHRPVQKLDCIEQGDFPNEIGKGSRAVGITFEIAH